MDGLAFDLAAVASPLRKWCRGITAEVASPAFGAKQASLQQQSACLLAVMKVQEKIDVAATALFQQEASIFVLTTHRLKKRAGLQRRVGLEKLPQGLSHPDYMSIDSSYIPAS